MIAALIVAATLASGGPDIGARIGEAAAAEQSLRGPLEGAWILRDARGHALFDMQIADPLDGRLGGAWRDLAAGTMGVIDGGARGGGLTHLLLIAGDKEARSLIVRPDGRGRMVAGGQSSQIRLARP